MRIGIYTHYIDKYPRNAPSLYQVELIRKFIEKTNLEVVLLHHRKSSHPIYNLVEEVILPKFPYLREKEVDKLNLDLLHFNAIPWSWWPTIAKLNTLSIATVHGTIHWDAPYLNIHRPLKLHVIKKIFEKQIVKYITHFIAVSRYVHNILIEKLNIPKSKIDVIYLPIDHDIFKPLNDGNVQKVKIQYSIKTKYILHVSNFSRAKNPNAVIEIFSSIKKKTNENIQLVIVGSKWNNINTIKIINKLGLQEYVKILGWVPQKNLAALYNGAEVLIHPSLHETFCFPLVEAMACGCPVIASNIMAVPEVVSDAAILCNPYDIKCFVENILSLLQDNSLREKIIKKGLQKAKQFNWNNHIDRVLSVYRKITKYSI